MQESIDLVRGVEPKAKWSQPKPFVSEAVKGYLVTIEVEYAVYDSFVGGQQGASTDKFAPPPQPTRKEKSFDQLLLVPEGKNAGSIAWPALKNRYAIFESDLGEGMGYHWYGRGPVYFLFGVRSKAHLSGGEPTGALLIRALPVEDEGSCTRNTAGALLSDMGSESVPYLRDAIDRGNKDLTRECIAALGRIHTQESDDLLEELYGRRDPEIRKLVIGYAVWPPYHPALKHIYADALSEPSRRTEAAQAAAELGWTDLRGQIQQAYLDASSVRDALVIYEAADRLGPRVLDEFVSTDPTKAEVVQKIMACPDKTYVALVGLKLIAAYGKSPSDFRKQGLRLLDSVSPTIAKPLIDRFKLSDQIEQLRKGI